MSKLLSQQMLETAQALRDIRRRLYDLVRQGSYPHDLFRDMSRVLTESIYVAESLERLASNEPAPRTPTHLDERR